MSKRSVFRPRSFDNETWIVVRYDDTDGLSELFRAGEIQTVDGESLAGTGREHLFSVGDPCLAPWKKQGHFPAVVAVISDDKTECLKEKERVIKSDKTKKDATGRKKYGDRKKKPNKADSGSIMENTKPTGKSVPKAPKENEASSVKRKKQDSGSAKENKKPTGKSVPKAPEENETSSVKRKKQELQKEAKRAKEAQTAAAQDIAASLFIACLEKKHGR